ncbi:MAG: ABC transporter permease [Planctomycetes bacterium]|nr:ABC transporter permease [Planctomycetota bacterium]
MLAGPLFSRETLTVPRQFKHFLIRSGYVAALFVLMYTTAQTTFGWQAARNLGDIARFGQLVFQIFAFVQMTLMIFFSVLFAAGNVAQEKDRRTLLLLLMSDLRDSEFVLGKLCASLLLPAVLLVSSIPVFAFVQLLGGVSVSQIACVIAISAASGFLAGCWGSLVAFWREKTFQTLAISLIGAVLALGVIEGTLVVVGSATDIGQVIGALNPFRALVRVLDPLNSSGGFTYISAAVMSAGELTAAGAILATIAILRLRVWNPSRTLGESATRDENLRGVVRPPRVVWNSPVIWREMKTKAYGRKVILIKLAYLVIAAFSIYSIVASPKDSGLVLGMISPAGAAFVTLSLLTMLLVNAQAVTSLTTERDSGTLELLLVTDVTAKEFILGKLGGVLYNSKELILTPLLFVAWYAVNGTITLENFIYIGLGQLTLVLFAAMLGLHSGLSYGISRTAIANSLGTVFFLFVGIFICMILILQTRDSFGLQLPSFLVFILGGSLGLWASLTHRNPSPALTLAAGILPFCTFYAITSFLLGQTLGVCLFVVAAYGFTVIAMLIPAISEFDTALGRSVLPKG